MAQELTYINPYFNAEIISFSDGSQVLKRTMLEYDPSANKDQTHTVKDNDNLWALAYFYYGDDKWWYVIADINKIYNPLELEVGSEIIIPDLDIVRASK